MSTVEIEGKTIDEAIEKACREFNVPREKLNIEIISEGSTGFLGIGSRKALIKASLINFDMAFEAAPVVERPSMKAVPSASPKEAMPAERPPAKPAPLKTPPAKPEAVKTPVRETQSVRTAPAEAAKEAHDNASAPAPRKPEVTAESNEKITEKAKSILEGILSRMGVDLSVTTAETDEAITLNIEGDSGGLLIGKRGQNLDAIQYIVNKATSQSENGRKPIIIDSGSYRKRREESLLTLAAKLGEKVKKTKKAVTVSNMNAHDRRIIHLALQNDTSLVTKSRGEGDYRKIVIMPAKKPKSARNAS